MLFRSRPPPAVAPAPCTAPSAVAESKASCALSITHRSYASRAEPQAEIDFTPIFWAIRWLAGYRSAPAAAARSTGSLLRPPWWFPCTPPLTGGSEQCSAPSAHCWPPPLSQEGSCRPQRAHRMLRLGRTLRDEGSATELLIYPDQ